MRTGTVVRHANRASVLEFIKLREPVSRADIAKELRMSRSAVSAIVDELLVEGLIREGGMGQSTRRGGRPSVQLWFVPTARYVMGIDIGGTKTMFMVTDLNGNVVARQKISSHAEGVDSLTHIRHEVEKFLCSTGVHPKRIVGTGIGAPGLTSHESGVVIAAPALQWSDVNLRAAFHNVVPEPIFVDNDVNMAVVGEKWKGNGRGYRDVVLVAIGTGIGAGVMINGQIHRGFHGYAGEIGYFQVDPLNESKASRHEFGAFERLASGTGIARRARSLLEEYPNSVLHGRDITSELVFEAATNNDELAIVVLRHTVKYIAAAIANIVALLNPGVVILGGGVSQAGAEFISSIKSEVQDLIPIPVNIVQTALGEDAGAFGAAATALVETGNLNLHSSSP